MDPLSIISGVIAIAAAAGQIGTAISRLRHLGEVPGKIYALKNEVGDLEVVLRQVGHALEQGSLEPENAHVSLEQVLARTKGILTDLTKALERLAKATTGSRIKVISKSTIWLREKSVFQGLRDDILSVKATLNLMLSTGNSQSLHHIILELQKVTVWTSKSEQANESISQGLKDSHLALSTRIDQQHQFFSDRFDAMGRLFLAQHLPGSDTPQLQSGSVLAIAGSDTQSVRVVATHRLPCRSWCPCVCHRKSKMKLSAPGLMEGVLGRMFVGYAGLPLLKQPCDFRGCRDKQNPTATVEYWFPSWFVSMNLRLHLTYLPRAGPEFQMSTTRRVADDSQSITFAMQGNIEGLKHLFMQGLAGPRDVSDSRGYTLMRWALYGGMHNYETVQFLLHEGALVDENSYENVWDFLFRGKCSDKQQAGLRCITEGGEGDWMEEQNFPLIHRIIFGLSLKSLATELDENPHAVYITDAQSRTALDWATARCQLDDMALLIKYGADPNNMDVTGRTPVLHAVDSHNAESLYVILRAGGNPNPTYPKGLFRSSPLTAAGFAGMPTLLKHLLDFEADPNASNPEGLTALHSVSRTHNTECALLLLEYGANLNAKSSNGQTPMTTAIIHNNHPVLRLFVDRCHEYITANRFDGPTILPIIASHADIETINIVASVHPLKVSYDLSPSSIAANRALLEQRRDYNEKLADAFDELIAVATAEIEETKSIESVLESGFFLSARSSFHSELAGAISKLNSVDVSPDDSGSDDDDDGEEERWEDARPHFHSSPGSPVVSPPSSPTATGGQHFPPPPPLLPSPPKDQSPSHAVPNPSPLRRELSR